MKDWKIEASKKRVFLHFSFSIKRNHNNLVYQIHDRCNMHWLRAYTLCSFVLVCLCVLMCISFHLSSFHQIIHKSCAEFAAIISLLDYHYLILSSKWNASANLLLWIHIEYIWEDIRYKYEKMKKKKKTKDKYCCSRTPLFYDLLSVYTPTYIYLMNRKFANLLPSYSACSSHSFLNQEEEKSQNM